MSVEQNKELVRQYYELVSRGEREQADALFADDATWWVAGEPEQLPIAGLRPLAEHKAMLRNTVLPRLPHGVRTTITGMTAEGDRVAVEMENEAETASGEVYDNRFHLLFEIRDGRIRAVREYLGTLHARDVLLGQRSPGPARDVRIEKVRFSSGAETLTGLLHLPDGPGPFPGLVVSGPWKTVKEQVPSGYARELAARGYAALAFDFRSWGESGGRPRSMEDPFAKAEDIVAAASFLTTRPEVAPGGIGGLAVCASSGYLARAATMSTDIVSVALVAPGLPDHDTVVQQVGGAEGVASLQRVAREAQEQYERTGTERLEPAVVPTPQNTVPGADYYTNPDRGLIPEWDNTFNPASWTHWLAFDAQEAAPHLMQPLFVITSHAAVSPESVRQFIAAVPRPVDQRWIDGIPQFDWYDRPAPVALAADAVAAHFARTMPRPPARD